MSAGAIGRVKARSGRSVEVKWTQPGWSSCGRASSAAEAMRRAEAFLYDK
jgi:hypothetical protein